MLFLSKKPGYRRVYYDGGGPATGNMGRVGLETTSIAPVSVAEETALPAKFSLDQNFPNPFNPGTVISCQPAF